MQYLINRSNYPLHIDICTFLQLSLGVVSLNISVNGAYFLKDSQPLLHYKVLNGLPSFFTTDHTHGFWGFFKGNQFF
jgi:hypothetical protein